MLDRETIQRQAGVLKALGHESRLLIVHRLGTGDCTAGELTDLVGSDQSTVSKHLAVLRLHGIVKDRRDGNRVVYSLRTPCILDFFACTGRVISELHS